MIKFTAPLPNGGHLLGLGLTRTNLIRLQQGQPIAVNLVEMGSPDLREVAIFYGEDERSLREQLSPMITDNTKVTVDPRLKDN